MLFADIKLNSLHWSDIVDIIKYNFNIFANRKKDEKRKNING